MPVQKSPKWLRWPRIWRRANTDDAASGISISWSLPSNDDLTLVWEDIFSLEPVLYRGGLPVTEAKRSTALSSQSTLTENRSESNDTAKKDELEDTTGNDRPASVDKFPNDSSDDSAPDGPEANEENILTGIKLVTAVLSLLLTILCVALDNTSALLRTFAEELC